MTKYAVYSATHGWLQDTCAGGAFSWNVEDAVWFDSVVDAQGALAAAEIEVEPDDHFTFVRVK